ncbi:MAG: hypothetical protein Q4D41_06890, partial [Prevotellaceae bacterium]|nr:hypothetical protein [Prevotellaceae bacterium]
MQIKSYSIISPKIIFNASFFRYVIYHHCLYQKITEGKAFTDNPITQRFYRLANKELMSPSLKDWRDMKDLISDEVPELKAIAHKHSLKDIEYEICILVLLG